MANEIYDSTWWGNTIDTASSIGTSTEMIQGQFNLIKIGDELITNGDFATDSDWDLGSGWTISGGSANSDGINFPYIKQNGALVSGKTYQLTFDITSYTSGSIKYEDSVETSIFYSGLGSYNQKFTASSNNCRFQSAGFNGSIDNVSVKQVRATTVEASKCLADTIHRIGLQDIQN